MSFNHWDEVTQPPNKKVDEQYEAELFRRAFHASLSIATETGERLRKEFRHNLAESLIYAGFTVTPSQYLRDHEVVVSEAVYKEVQRQCNLVRKPSE